MKNKKIVVFLLIAVLVLGMTLTALVGCKDYKDVDYEKMSEFLAAAIENTAESKKINNMKLGATMTIDTTYGDSKKTYTIDLAAALSLKDDSNKNSASLEIKEGEKNIVSAYYFEESGSDVYLRLGESGRFRLNGVLVKEIMNKNNASVSDDQATEITDSAVDGITSVLDTLAIITDFDGVKAQVSKKGTAYRLAINVGDLLNGLLNSSEDEGDSISGLVGDILEDLNLDVNAKELGNVLPNIELGININVSNKKAEKAVITGISADLSCPSKNVVIAKKNNKGNLLELNISKDFSAKADIALKFDNDVAVKSDDWNAYPVAGIGAINLTAKGSFELKNAIKVDNLLGMLNIDIPADTYNLEVGISADPAKLVKMDFTGIHSLPHAIDKAIDAVNSAVDYLNLKITKKSGEVFLQVELGKDNANADLKIKTINVAALGLAPSITNILKGSIKDVWALVPTLGFEIPANLDAGYAYKDESQGWKGGYKVDTANGYVDENKDDEPDRDKDGNYVVGADFELYKGYPLHKSKCGYVDSNGTWVVDTDNGYVETKKGSNQVKFDKNGDFAVGTGYVLYQGRPMLKTEYDKLEKEEEETSLIPATVKDLINNLSIVAKDGKISINLSGMSFALDSKAEDVKYATLTAAISLDKTGITLNAKATGLDEVKIKGEDGVYNSIGLPAEIGVEIVIKFTDIKYGAIK